MKQLFRHRFGDTLQVVNRAVEQRDDALQVPERHAALVMEYGHYVKRCHERISISRSDAVNRVINLIGWYEREGTLLTSVGDVLQSLHPMIARDFCFLERVKIDTGTKPISSSDFSEPGKITLNAELINTHVDFIEHLYHETIHQKLFVLYYLSIKSGGFYEFPEASEIEFKGSWHSESGLSIDRAVAAAHVYSHLFVLSVNSEKSDNSVSKRGTVQIKRFFELSNFLIEHNRAFSDQGREFVSWLTEQDGRIPMDLPQNIAHESTLKKAGAFLDYIL